MIKFVIAETDNQWYNVSLLFFCIGLRVFCFFAVLILGLEVVFNIIGCSASVAVLSFIILVVVLRCFSKCGVVYQVNN